MKKAIKTISELIGMLWSFIYGSTASTICCNILSHIYTGYVRRRFAHFGKDAVIAYKACNLAGLSHVSIGRHTQINEKAQITTWNDGILIIGNNCILREGIHMSAFTKITIGDNLLTGTNVLITDNSHGAFVKDVLMTPPHSRPIVSKGEVMIGNNVWLGNNVCIMPGVNIGDGVIVGANSVVTKDIPSFSMAAGVPAKIIKDIKK